MSDRIKKAYKESSGIYDDALTQSSLFGKLYIKLFWDGMDVRGMTDKVLANIPADFSGKLLDVPCGTAVFTYEKWKSLKNADITCVDYSPSMLAQAEKRTEGEPHIHCKQGDVGNLPMADETFDLVQTMNGLHVFPDKPKALRELYRVLKPGGLFIGSLYVKGESRKTDLIAKTLLEHEGWLTRPFWTKEQWQSYLERHYHDVKVGTVASMAYFSCRK